MATECRAPGRAVLLAMGQRLAHRGPDAAGVFVDVSAGVGLVHRRLSILDLSDAGSQPMTSPSGRYLVAYNGEIYNHAELRAELEAAGRAPAWRGHSDTETLLALIDVFGLEPTLERLRGMFALALWDRQERRLSLARDRIGEKPLYYGRAGKLFVFTSELSALHALEQFRPSIDRGAVRQLLRYSVIPAPDSIYAGIRKLRPGCIVELGHDQSAPVERPYWRLSDVIARTAPARAASTPYEELVERTEAVLARVVRDQTISDRPLGVFLSGGIDSSLVTALMAAGRGHGQVRTFSIGFEQERFNEAGIAREVARHLGTSHTEFIVTEADALDVSGALGGIYSEPFADSSQIPLVLLSRMTRQDVTVALSGDGGDEMFGGYNRHVMAPRLWARARRFPKPIRRLAAGLVRSANPALGDRGAERLMPLVRRLGLPLPVVDRLAHFADAVGGADSLDSLYAGLVGRAADARRLCIGEGDEAGPAGASTRLPDGLSDAERLFAWDALWYLPDDVLVKVDRASMSASLETRAPFLDPEAIEAAWSLPLSAKIGPRGGKRILRDILRRHVPAELMDRPKQGFAVPLDSWLRGPLRRWADERLDDSTALEATGLDRAAVGALWKSHLDRKVNAGATLWSALMLIDWHAVWHRNVADLQSAPMEAQAGGGA